MKLAAGYLIYVSPYDNGKNTFTRMQIGAFERLGATVGEIRSSMLLDWTVSSRRKVAVLNWYEDRVFNSHRVAINLMMASVFLLWLRLRVSHVVWMRHNFTPHKYDAAGAWAYSLLKRLLGKVATVVVTMRPCQDIPSLVVPHPAYAQPFAVDGVRDIELLWFGQVRRNKNIPWLLQHLRGTHKRMLIAGECNEPKLREEIHHAAAENDVRLEWVDRFLPQDELEALLRRTRYLILTHADNSAIFSGSFMHAASFGVNVLLRDSDFARYAAAQYSFCQIIDADRGIDPCGQDYVAPRDVMLEVQSRHGQPAVDAAWLLVFQHIGLKMDAAGGKP